MLGEVPVFGILHHGCRGAARDREPEDIRCVDQVMIEVQGRNCLELLYLVLLPLLKGDVPAIEIIAIFNWSVK